MSQEVKDTQEKPKGMVAKGEHCVEGCHPFFHVTKKAGGQLSLNVGQVAAFEEADGGGTKVTLAGGAGVIELADLLSTIVKSLEDCCPCCNC